MRHFLRTTLAIALLTQRVSTPTAQRVLVAAPGCAHARAAHETPARIRAIALAAITRGADAKQSAAACTVHASVIVAHVPESPHRGLDAARSTADTAAIGSRAFGRAERWSPEGPRADG